MNRNMSLIVIFLAYGLMVSCGSADKSNVSSETDNLPNVARGINSGESESFITTVETLNQDNEVKSEFATEIVRIRVRIMNKSKDKRLLKFRHGAEKALVEIYSGPELVWTSKSMVGIALIEENELFPNDHLEVNLKWNLLDRLNRLVAPGTYHVVTRVQSEEFVPIPGIVEFDVR
jgi:hypothetical protein